MTLSINDEFIKKEVNPIVWFLYNSGRGAEIAQIPDSMDWDILRSGTARITALLKRVQDSNEIDLPRFGLNAKLQAAEEKIASLESQVDDYRKHLGEIVTYGADAATLDAKLKECFARSKIAEDKLVRIESILKEPTPS